MTSPDQIPDDIASLKRLNEQLMDLVRQQQTQIKQLTEELNLFKRKFFGQTSERHDDGDGQLHLFESASPPVQDADDVLPVPPKPRRPKAKAKEKEKEKFPEHLRRDVRYVDAAEGQRACPGCNVEMPIIGQDVTERLDLVPAELFVIETHSIKRACGKCKDTVLQVPAGQGPDGATTPVPGSDYGFGVYTQLIVGKFADHLPLYRMQDIFARSGLVIPRSTQCGMLASIADLVTPLVDLMAKRLTDSKVIGVDDTTVRMQDASLPGKMRTARFWLYRGREAQPYNVFEFHDSRKRDGPAAFLKDFKGHAVVDAYGVNDGVYLGSGGRIQASCCNAHARRKFVDAKSNDPVAAAQALAMYQGLYDIEDRARDWSDAKRLKLRQSESQPIMKKLHGWLLDQRSNPRVLPKSSLGKAVRYALNQWQELSVFLSDGSIPIDNNDTERELRRLTIGRKNWLFVGSAGGGKVAAKLYSLVSSATRNQLDAWAYVDDVLRQLASGRADLECLLPDKWKAVHPEHVREYRQNESTGRRLTTKQRRTRRRDLAEQLGG